MSDAHKCFTHLKENSPKWLADLLALEKHVEEKQKEMEKADVCSDEAMPRPVRNGSVASIKEQGAPNGFHTAQNCTDSSSHSPEDSAHLSASRRRNVLVKRSKRPSSILSTTMSAAPKFRTRNMIIIYYDAEIQKSFEKLVREIGSGRHIIRKAKMAAQAEAFAGGIDDEELYGMADDAIAPDTKVMNFRRTTTSESQSKLTNWAKGMSMPAFQQADKALERAQSLCERAAHQYLRDGDCRLEMGSAKEAFQDVLKTSTEELARLELREKPSNKMSYEIPLRPNVVCDERPGRDNESQPSSGSMGFANIEVDDEEEQMPVDLPTLRMTSRMGPRRGPK